MNDDTNTIDFIMSKDPLELSARDLDMIIAYQRKDRARADRGEKPDKPGAKAKKEPTKTTINLEELGFTTPKKTISDRRY